MPASRAGAGRQPGGSQPGPAATGLAALARRLWRHADSQETGNFNYAYTTARALADRYKLAADLLHAYRRKDRKGIQVVKRRIGKVADAALELKQP